MAQKTQITSRSQIVNLNDVKKYYADSGYFTATVNSIKSCIICELEELANKDVIKYGEVGTKPLFELLIESLEDAMAKLKGYAVSRYADFKTIHDQEEKSYQEYLKQEAEREAALNARRGDIG